MRTSATAINSSSFQPNRGVYFIFLHEYSSLQKLSVSKCFQPVVVVHEIKILSYSIPCLETNSSDSFIPESSHCVDQLCAKQCANALLNIVKLI